MIYIDFQGGAHGNYLEFVCNKFLARVPTSDMPFNSKGAAHAKIYLAQQEFHAWHYFDFQGQRTTPDSGKIVSIRITHDDLLPLTSISLLRAGDYGLDNAQLEIDTYNKLDNENYRWVLDNIIRNFSEDLIKKSYDAVKDPSWPPVSTMEDFLALPDEVRKECIEQHHLEIFELSKDRPDCPRSVLIEFFKIGFKFPEHSGFIAQQEKMFYNANNDVWYFPYSCFYHIDEFLDQIEALSAWAGYPPIDRDQCRILHREFLKRQPYKDTKSYCDAIFDGFVTGNIDVFPPLDLLQESYLLSRLEHHYGKTDINTLDYFSRIIK